MNPHSLHGQSSRFPSHCFVHALFTLALTTRGIRSYNHFVVHYVTDIAHRGGTTTEHGRDDYRQLHLSVSPALHARLAHEAAERGMQLEDWAVLRLGGLSRVARSSLAHVQPVPRWRTRC